MAKQYALTTTDNPYNPFDDFASWYKFDNDHGYGTCSYLARVSPDSSYFTDMENDQITNESIDQIIALDPFNMYKRVGRDVEYDEFGMQINKE